MIRPLGTKEETEKKKKRNVLLISILLIAIMVLSTAGYFSLNRGESSSAQTAQQVGGEWYYKYGDATLKFTNSLEDTKNITITTTKTLKDYYGNPLYLVSDNQAVTYEIGQNLGNYVLRMQEACYGNCTKNVPSKNCTDLLIVYNQSADSKVYEFQNCIFIEGDLRAVDSFLYRIFGIK